MGLLVYVLIIENICMVYLIVAIILFQINDQIYKIFAL